MTIFGFILLYYLTTNTVSENEIVNITPIETSIGNVKIKFKELEKIISVESMNIDNLFSEIYDEINTKNKEIKNTRVQHNKLREEINHYKKLANISQEEAKAIRQEIDKNDSINYLISFALGILSSGLVWGLTQLKFVKNFSKMQ
ncbi:hypothetical protein PG911_08930 [Tenacibaculum ovolyticum]|uniref:hypothetical protein n=1 Tax=Tenacibaculum ovolyticum TaxID=104270 RepID=UPI0022F3E1F6|nr:hypothetical protein [Tenacibaculum ovolyticum]WBX78370.1 hypothetical protein PG911_08930 [Tenacibaculum ovolyticum]